MSSIQQQGRFVRLVDGQWIVISNVEARQKIAHAIQYRIRNDHTVMADTTITELSAVPASLFATSVPAEAKEARTLELERHEPQREDTTHLLQSLRSLYPTSVNQMYDGELGVTRRSPTGEQHPPQEPSYLNDNRNREWCCPKLEPSDAPRPPSSGISFHPVTGVVPRVSNVMDHRTVFLPQHPEPFSVQPYLDPFIHEKSRAVSDFNIHHQSYEQPYDNNGIQQQQQQQQQQQSHLLLNDFSPHTGTIQRSCDLESAVMLENPIDPPLLQPKHSFSSMTEIEELYGDSKIAAPTLLAWESGCTINSFQESGSSLNMSSLSNHQNPNPFQGYEATTAENIQQQMQQLGEISNGRGNYHPPNGDGLGHGRSALSLLWPSVSQYQRHIESACIPNEPTSILFPSSSSALCDLVARFTLPKPLMEESLAATTNANSVATADSGATCTRMYQI